MIIDSMEREAEFEPATSSLGKGTSFENKEHHVLAGFILATEVIGFLKVRLSREA